MRRLAAALGALVLMATVAAGPVAAAKPIASFEASICSYTYSDSSLHYSIDANWPGVHGVYELATAPANQGTYLGAYNNTWVVKGETSVVGADVIASSYSGYDSVWVGLLSHKQTQLVSHFFTISSITACP